MERIEAAGGLLWRQGHSGPEVALVHRPKYEDWSLPKGKLKRGEHPLLGALREVHEETSFAARPGRPLGESLYDKEGREKRVRWWAMEALHGDFIPGAEVDDLRWETPQRAREVLTAQRDRLPLDEFTRDVARTVPLLVVRHARAGERSSWRGDDRRRPLDDDGRRQAKVLAEVLAAYEPQLLLSADVERCVQTLEPLADATGLAIRPKPLFSEDGYAQDPDAALDLLHAIASGGRSAVVCTQRGPLPGLVQQLHQTLGGGPLDVDPPPKGATVVLHLAEARVVAAELLPAP